MQPNQNTFSFFTETEKNPKILMKIKNIMKRQNNPEQEEHVRGTTVPDLELYYKNCDKSSMILAQKQTRSPVE